MIRITIQQLIEILNAECTRTVEPDAPVCGVTIDSRAMTAGQAFIAVQGDRFDGHDFAAAAAQQGAACIIAERKVTLPSDNVVPVLIVGSTLDALPKLARWYRGRLSAAVVAITGSAGKTTTRHILHHVLSRRFRCHQAVKSFNNHIGVPLTILAAPSDAEILLLELGTNHPGEIEPLARIAEPDRACITLIGPAHLEGFGSVEKILIEKASIAKGLKPEGTLYVNGDQPELLAYARTLRRRVIAFGTSPGCDVIGSSLETEGLCGTLTIDGQRVSVPLAGRGNLMNVLTAWSICRDLKVSLSDFIEAIATLPPAPMRMAIETLGDITLLNDCYNANPASMANALDVLSRLVRSTGRRGVFVAGSMGELGVASADLHRQLGRQAVRSGAACLLACGAFASDIVAGAREGGFAGQSQVFPSTADLCDKLHSFILPADIILVKGSRSAGLEAAVEVLKVPLKPRTKN